METNFDIIIVGAGVLGTFHAYHAAVLGKKVLLTEKDQYPINATVRNFGQAVPSGMPDEWLEYGRRGLHFYKTIQQEFDISVRQNGSVYIASDDDEQQLIHELKSKMDGRGYPCHLMSTNDIVAKWPSLKKSYCKEALFFPEEVSVEPEKLIYRLLEYVCQKFPNISYKPSTTVIDCDSKGNTVSIRTNHKQTFTADKLIVCNGGEFKILFSDLFNKSGIVLSKLQMMRTVPMPHVALEGNILTGLTIRRYESFQSCPSFTTIKTPQHLAELKKWGVHILFKKASDHSIIIGDSHEYASVSQADDLGFSTQDYINTLMLTEAERIVDFDVHQIATTWAGFYPQHEEKDIVEYDIDNCIYIRTAIGGKGMTSACGYAEWNIHNIFSL
jgi:FAD dependent oxidoreductase TIGR03364